MLYNDHETRAVPRFWLNLVDPQHVSGVEATMLDNPANNVTACYLVWGWATRVRRAVVEANPGMQERVVVRNLPDRLELVYVPKCGNEVIVTLFGRTADRDEGLGIHGRVDFERHMD